MKEYKDKGNPGKICVNFGSNAISRFESQKIIRLEMSSGLRLSNFRFRFTGEKVQCVCISIGDYHKLQI